MYRTLLPALLALVILSCGKQTNETSSVPRPDSASAAAIDPSEDPTNDTAYNGNTDGDYFMSADSTEGGDGEDDQIREMIDVHQPTIDVCGFSADGKYFAFTQSLVGDGPDGTGSVFIIDVAKNEWATKPGIIETSNEDLDKEVAKVRDQMLSKYNISYQKNPGQVESFAKSNKVIIEGKPYEVILDVTNLLIDLRVKGNGKDITLQKDKKLPASRGSVREYRLNNAYVLGDKIAVFVEYDGDIFTGFENYRYYDRKNIVVTGIIK